MKKYNNVLSRDTFRISRFLSDMTYRTNYGWLFWKIISTRQEIHHIITSIEEIYD
jgi:hypothetical protein